MSEVRHLKLVDRKVEISDSVTKALEWAVDEAKKGDVVAISIAIVRPVERRVSPGLFFCSFDLIT